MTLSIIVPNVQFAKRTQLYAIPALDRNHVFAVFGASRERSLNNLNVSKPSGSVVGSVAFAADGVRVLGNVNAVRFAGLTGLSGQGCTIMAVFKTPAVPSIAGVVSLWAQSALAADSLSRRILLAQASPTDPVYYNSSPGATDTIAAKTIAPNKEYVLSLTRGPQGSVSQLRLHNADGSVALYSPITELGVPVMPYAADTVFDIGMSSAANQAGVVVKGAGLWSGIMTEAEIAAAAAFMYQATH